MSALPDHFQSFLAFDFGVKRTGVAYGSRMLHEAQPQATVNAEGDARWPLITKRIAEWQPDALVVGVPFHPDGAAHENTAKAKKFARQLNGRFNLPVFECSRPPHVWWASPRVVHGWRLVCKKIWA
jgi:putative Holliday junction resolvase